MQQTKKSTEKVGTVQFANMEKKEESAGREVWDLETS